MRLGYPKVGSNRPLRSGIRTDLLYFLWCEPRNLEPLPTAGFDRNGMLESVFVADLVVSLMVQRPHQFQMLIPDAGSHLADVMKLES